MKLVIDRNEWYRGNLAGSRLVRREDGKMCCVGIYLTACGVDPDKLLGISSAHARQVATELREDNVWLITGNSDAGFTAPKEVFDLYMTNDSPNITEEARENAVKYIFGQHGVEVEFIN